jgi:hypothetical protein
VSYRKGRRLEYVVRDMFRRWSVMGVWSKVLEALIAMGCSTGRLRLDKPW